MPGSGLTECKRQGPYVQWAGQIINNHTDEKNISSDDTMLGVSGQLAEMVSLQISDGKGTKEYPGCTLMPRCLTMPTFSRSRHWWWTLEEAKESLEESCRRPDSCSRFLIIPSPSAVKWWRSGDRNQKRIVKGCVELKCSCQRVDSCKWAVGALLLTSCVSCFFPKRIIEALKSFLS